MRKNQKKKKKKKRERKKPKEEKKNKKNELNHILLHCIIIQYCISSVSNSCRLRNLIRKLGLGLGDRN